MAGADAALSILESEPSLVERLRENVRFFVDELAHHGLSVSTDSAIVPIIIGDEERAVACSSKLAKAGFAISAIRYPTVAKGSARLRVAVSSAHSREALVSAASAIASVFR